MVPALQAKLLRFLEEKSFKRVGGAGDIRVDVRVVAATNRNLEDQVAKGGVPQRPLLPAQRAADSAAGAARARRRRAGAGELLRRQLQRRVQEAHHRREPRQPATLLKGYGWPGNVRELRNVVERAMLLAEGPQLEAHDFGALQTGRAASDPFDLPADRRRPRGARAQPGRAGAAAGRRQPDEGGGAARAQPGSDPLPDREVRPLRDAVATHVRRTIRLGSSSRSATRWTSRRSSRSPISAASSPTSTTSSARSPNTRATSCSARITASSTPAITRRSSSAGCGGRSRRDRSGAASCATARRTDRSTGSIRRSSRCSTRDGKPRQYLAIRSDITRARRSSSSWPTRRRWRSSGSSRRWSRTKCAIRWPA